MRKYSKPSDGIRRHSADDKNFNLNSQGSSSNQNINQSFFQTESDSDKFTIQPITKTNNNPNMIFTPEVDSTYLDENVSVKRIPEFIKQINSFEIFEKSKISDSILKDEAEQLLLESTNFSCKQTRGSIDNPYKSRIFPVVENILDKDNLKFNFSTCADDTNDDTDEVLYEGYMYKLTVKQELQRKYYKLIQKDLYCYQNKLDEKHKSMNNLSGAFCREGMPLNFDGQEFLSIQIINNSKTKFLHVNSSEIEEYNNWLKYFKKVTGYSDLYNTYMIGHKLGNGKFGIVRLGIHRITRRKVAIKMMNKCDMSFNDIQMVKTEIEILKICQHPYIIRLYEVYENEIYIYIGNIFALNYKYSNGILRRRRSF